MSGSNPALKLPDDGECSSISSQHLDPPVVVEVTHHSIELSWGSPLPLNTDDSRTRFCVEVEDCTKGGGFSTAYNGYSTNIVFSNLNVLTQYRYRVKPITDKGSGHWSPVITVATTRQPRTSENLHKAVQRGDVELVRTILETSPKYINVPDILGFCPLMNACNYGKADVVRVLLDLGADLEYRTSSGKTSLMEACYSGHLECVKLLVENGSSLMSRDHSGFSAVHYAADGGDISVLNYVLDEGVPVDDVCQTTLSGWTPLMRIASVGGNASVASVLVERGASINRRDNEGKTVLMLACVNGFEELVELLLDSGANPLLKNEYGKNALDFAESFKRHVVIELLEAKLEARGMTVTS